MALSNYRIHADNVEHLRAELNAILDAIGQRLATLENGPIAPTSDIDMTGGTGQAAKKIRNLAPATDDHDAVTLGQLQDALASLKRYIDTDKKTTVKYIKRQARP